MASFSSSPSDGPVSSSENHRVAQHIKEIKRRCHEAADAQTSKAVRMVKGSRVDLRAGEQGFKKPPKSRTCAFSAHLQGP
ncbi:hypothetical protein PoB_001007700 [Plakobranchus ocellatus]|uniref:Uncharacterized protein n=1 Tax=Plakobranchus ocellatus TaxID=259542 RepID=A0AAV3YN87_9GAST|nr:hypothetical protein PoB_001007700 [Plakobranchus ocellatus]